MWFGPLSLTKNYLCYNQAYFYWNLWIRNEESNLEIDLFNEHTCAKLQHIHELEASSCPHQTRAQTCEQGPKNTTAMQKINYRLEWSGAEWSRNLLF